MDDKAVKNKILNSLSKVLNLTNEPLFKTPISTVYRFTLLMITSFIFNEQLEHIIEKITYSTFLLL